MGYDWRMDTYLRGIILIMATGLICALILTGSGWPVTFWQAHAGVIALIFTIRAAQLLDKLD